MENIIIDDEFRYLLPTLDDETYNLLEENLIQNGCRDSLVLWGNILIDGHNRYEICTKHDIPFSTVEKTFDSREEALIWIITTQVSRRNLNPKQLSYYRGSHYRAEKIIVRNVGGKNQYSEVMGQKVPKAHTAERLAGQYKVSSKTINRDAKFATAVDLIGEVSPTAKRKILSDEVRTNRKKLSELIETPKEKVEEIASAIENGTYDEKKKAAEKTPVKQLEPSRLILAETLAFNTAIGKISDKAELKKALKQFMDKLGDLYMQI